MGFRVWGSGFGEEQAGGAGVSPAFLPLALGEREDAPLRRGLRREGRLRYGVREDRGLGFRVQGLGKRRAGGVLTACPCRSAARACPCRSTARGLTGWSGWRAGRTGWGVRDEEVREGERTRVAHTGAKGVGRRICGPARRATARACPVGHGQGLPRGRGQGVPGGHGQGEGVVAWSQASMSRALGRGGQPSKAGALLPHSKGLCLAGYGGRGWRISL